MKLNRLMQNSVGHFRTESPVNGFSLVTSYPFRLKHPTHPPNQPSQRLTDQMRLQTSLSPASRPCGRACSICPSWFLCPYRSHLSTPPGWRPGKLSPLSAAGLRKRDISSKSTRTGEVIAKGRVTIWLDPGLVEDGVCTFQRV